MVLDPTTDTGSNLGDTCKPPSYSWALLGPCCAHRLDSQTVKRQNEAFNKVDPSRRVFYAVMLGCLEPRGSNRIHNPPLSGSYFVGCSATYLRRRHATDTPLQRIFGQAAKRLSPLDTTSKFSGLRALSPSWRLSSLQAPPNPSTTAHATGRFL